MSVFRGIIDLVTVLIWPVTVIIIVWYFRKSLGALLQRLRSIEAPGGVKGTFGTEVGEISQLIADATADSLSKGANSNFSESDANEVRTPEIRVMLAWSQLNIALRRYRTDESDPGKLPLAREYAQRMNLPAEAVVAVDRLAELRNRAERELVTDSEAAEYERSVRELVLLIAAHNRRPAARVEEEWARFLASLRREWRDRFSEDAQPSRIIRLMRVSNVGSESVQQTYFEIRDQVAHVSSSLGEEITFEASTEVVKKIRNLHEDILDAFTAAQVSPKTSQPT